MQAAPLLLWAPTNLFVLGNSADPPGWCSLDSSAATCWGPKRCCCLGGATKGNPAKAESRTGSPRWQLGGEEVYHHHPDLQPHRRFAQTPKPLPGSTSSSENYHSMEQHWRADTCKAVELLGASSGPGSLQGADQQPNAQQATTIPWNWYWWSVHLSACTVCIICYILVSEQ